MANVKKSIIVIGAGMAGLSAAHRLAEHGYDVTVLEANDRIGGRIQTITAKNGDIIENGANWIHYPDFVNQMKNQPFLVPEQDIFSKAVLYDLNPSEHFEMEEVLTRVEYGVTLAHELEVGSDKVDIIKAYDLGESSDFFVTSGINQILEKEFDTEHLDIHLQSKVIKVVQTADGVEVSYSDNRNNIHVIKSDYIINTMPAKVLEANSHIFTPPLDTNLIDTLHSIQMTSVRKVSLTFDSQAFANATKENGDLANKLYLLFADKGIDMLILVINLNAMNIDSGKVGSTTLLAFIHYNYAQYADMSTDAITAQLVDMITSQFPSLDQEALTEVHDVDWAKNELSLGAWPYLTEHTEAEKLAAIKQGHGKMVLAGDWTVINSHDRAHYFLGDDMYAALVSGLNAAERIINLSEGHIEGSVASVN